MKRISQESIKPVGAKRQMEVLSLTEMFKVRGGSQDTPIAKDPWE